MKRFFSIILVIILIVFLAAGCVNGVSQKEYDALKQQLEIERNKTPVAIAATSTPTATPTVKDLDVKLGDTVTVMELSYCAPIWRTENAESGYYYYPFENNADGVLNVYFQEFSEAGGVVNSTIWDSYIEGLSPDSVLNRVETTSITGVPQLRLYFTKNVEGTTYMVDSITLVTKNYLYTMILGMPNEITDEIAKTFEAIIASFSIDQMAGVEIPIEEPTTQTIGQSNALETAYSYLSFMAFSYKGLIEQLEYEKFSHEDAVYAADHCGANWNEQAALSAKNYLDLMSFSRDGLIEQLEYEGFTHDQAVYGVEANGY